MEEEEEEGELGEAAEWGNLWSYIFKLINILIILNWIQFDGSMLAWRSQGIQTSQGNPIRHKW